MARSIINIITLLIIILSPTFSLAQTEKTFKTNYSVIHYFEDKDLNDFLWRIGGKRFEYSSDTGFAKSRVDRIVERVQNILDMHTKGFNVDIFLRRGDLTINQVAYYESKTNSIFVSVDNVSDGVFAHETAHAVIYKYFSRPPSPTAQEVLTQYVDKYLWSDY
ncbi:MAG: hypothetical protein WCY05_01405 [Candidatus Omnitrophota bacterium]